MENCVAYTKPTHRLNISADIALGRQMLELGGVAWPK